MKMIQSDEAMAIPKIVKERYDKLCDTYRGRIENSIKEFGQRGFSLTFNALLPWFRLECSSRLAKALGDIVEARNINIEVNLDASSVFLS